jgi:hypothetical protein
LVDGNEVVAVPGPERRTVALVATGNGKPEASTAGRWCAFQRRDQISIKAAARKCLDKVGMFPGCVQFRLGMLQDTAAAA